MKVVAAAILGVALSAACATRVPADALPFFPQVAPPPPGLEQVMLTGSFGGKPVIEKGCVKVRSLQSRATTTVLWYPGTELGRDAHGYFLRDRRSGRILRFDTPSGFGGGGAPADYVARAYPDVAKRCGGPYAFGYLSDLAPVP